MGNVGYELIDAISGSGRTLAVSRRAFTRYTFFCSLAPRTTRTTRTTPHIQTHNTQPANVFSICRCHARPNRQDGARARCQSDCAQRAQAAGAQCGARRQGEQATWLLVVSFFRWAFCFAIMCLFFSSFFFFFFFFLFFSPFSLFFSLFFPHSFTKVASGFHSRARPFQVCHTIYLFFFLKTKKKNKAHLFIFLSPSLSRGRAGGRGSDVRCGVACMALRALLDTQRARCRSTCARCLSGPFHRGAAASLLLPSFPSGLRHISFVLCWFTISEMVLFLISGPLYLHLYSFCELAAFQSAVFFLFNIFFSLFFTPSSDAVKTRCAAENQLLGRRLRVSGLWRRPAHQEAALGPSPQVCQRFLWLFLLSFFFSDVSLRVLYSPAFPLKAITPSLARASPQQCPSAARPGAFW